MVDIHPVFNTSTEYVVERMTLHELSRIASQENVEKRLGDAE